MIDLLIPRFDPLNPRSAIENMKLLADESSADVLAFVHDDVDIQDQDWMQVVQDFFAANPDCGLVGFGGALALGHPYIYKLPYDLMQLARYDYISNVIDAENHGRRVTVPVQVVVLDGFCQIFRRAAYEEMGGWQAVLNLGLTFHMYDFAAACFMARLGWKVWMLPIPCKHHGGRTSVSAAYDQWLHSQGIAGDAEVHRKAHEVCYREFRDVLPLKV